MSSPTDQPRAPRVYSYVVRNDSGFSPHPFGGWCTLACCKPKIRQTAQLGDLIVGLSRRCESVVYAMRVSERLDFADYWDDRRFRRRRADWGSTRSVERRGDNIYEPLGDGEYRQHRSAHWDHTNDREHAGAKRRDLGGQHVLVSRDFVYFGRSGPPLPREIEFLRVRRAHRCRFTAEQVAAVQRWFEGITRRGVQGRPHQWDEGDASWQPRCA